jgi:hypothetical protein
MLANLQSPPIFVVCPIRPKTTASDVMSLGVDDRGGQEWVVLGDIHLYHDTSDTRIQFKTCGLWTWFACDSTIFDNIARAATDLRIYPAILELHQWACPVE